MFSNNRYLVRTHFDHPVTVNETKRLPRFRFRQEMRFFNVLGGLEFIFTLPFCLIPFLHWIWRLPTIFASSTMISRELEGQTWNQMRVLPMDTREIIEAKFAAIFRYMDPTLNTMFYLRAAPVVIFWGVWAAAALTTIPTSGFSLWLANTTAIALAGGYIIVSPTLDVAVDGALGMFAGTLAPRRSTAIIIATLARTLLWVLPLALVIPLQYEFAATLGFEQIDVIQLRSLLVVAIFGPGYAFLWNVNPWLSSLLVIGTVLFRWGVMRALLELTIRRAERLYV